MGVIASDSFIRANVASGLGTATDGKLWTLNNSPAGTQDVTNNEGRTVNSGSSVLPEYTLGNVTLLNFDATVRVQFSSTTDVAFCLARFQSAGNFYYAGLDGASGKAIKKRVSNAGTGLAAATFTPTLSSVFYRIRFRGVGAALMMKLWQDGTLEPAAWDLSVTDTTYSVGGKIGVRIGTGTSANIVQFDHFSADDTTIVTSNAYYKSVHGHHRQGI